MKNLFSLTLFVISAFSQAAGNTLIFILTQYHRFNISNNYLVAALFFISYSAVAAIPGTPSVIPSVVGGSYHPYSTVIKVTLPTVANATSYKVYSSISDSNYTLVATTSSNQANIGTRSNWGYNYIKYKACNTSGCGGLSAWRRTLSYGSPYTAAPSAAVGIVTQGGKTTISWPTVGHAIYQGTHYERKYTRPNGTQVNLSNISHIGGTNLYSFETENLTQYGTYTFYVRGCNPQLPCGGWGKTTVSVPLPIPDTPSGIPSVVGGSYHPYSTVIKVTLPSVTNATSYKV
ncbi:hypothetical protein [Paraglaciecola sp.]|uniref:hypothetical protein n=1 Tax=Paraglaciecola sp. TaxID=1920173 RepID=UPI003EF6E456